MLKVFIPLCQFLFFLFNFLHDFFCLWILCDHNERYTDVSKYNCLDTEDILHLLLLERLIEVDCFFILLFHKQHMGHVESPCFVFETEFSWLLKYFFNLGLVFFLPLDFALTHQNWHKLFHCIVLILQWVFNTFIIACDACIIYLFSKRSEYIDVLFAYGFKFVISLFRACLL